MLWNKAQVDKTLPTLCRLLELYKQNQLHSALIVCPKPVIGSWWRDVDLFNSTDQSIFKKFMVVTNYEQLSTKTGKVEYGREWCAVVIDEGHYIKNRTSNRAKECLKHSLGAKYRYILTGTPIGNGQLENVYSLMSFLYPVVIHGKVCSTVLGTYREFENKYCILDKWFKPYAYKNVDDLQEIIDNSTYRVTKSECLDLPDKLPDEIYEVEMQEKAMYKQLHKDSTVQEFELVAENGLSRMAKLRQMCSGFIQTENGLEELKCEKLKTLSEYIDNNPKKLVIFCEYKYSMNNIINLLISKKVKHVYLNGDQPDKSIWKKFQSDENVQVIICQYQSGSAGIDLFKADTILYYEPTLSSTILEQSRDRIHRIGQSQKCSYIFFITKGTIEEKIYKALKGYSDFNKKLFTEYLSDYKKGYRG